jgi:hypothetical protein
LWLILKLHPVYTNATLFQGCREQFYGKFLNNNFTCYNKVSVKNAQNR